MLTDEALRQELEEAAESVPPLPPSTHEVLLAGRRRGRRGLLIVALAAAVTATALASIALFGATKVRPLDIPLVSQPTTVPDVVGMPLREAGQTLRNAGLLEQAGGGCGEQQARCRVVSQAPAAGRSVEDGTVVKLRVAASPRLVRLPNVKGTPAPEAMAKL